MPDKEEEFEVALWERAKELELSDDEASGVISFGSSLLGSEVLPNQMRLLATFLELAAQYMEEEEATP